MACRQQPLQPVRVGDAVGLTLWVWSVDLSLAFGGLARFEFKFDLRVLTVRQVSRGLSYHEDVTSGLPIGECTATSTSMYRYTSARSENDQDLHNLHYKPVLP